MKKKFVALTLSLLAFIYLSCDGNRATKAESLIDYRISLDQWNNLKDSNGNSYKYTISTRSVFGSGTNTTITVINGIVFSRVHESYSLFNEDTGHYLGFENRIVLENFTENKTALNTHASGAPAITIDNLYDSCLREYLSVDASDNKVVFNYDSNDIIKDCYYIPDGCMDDCTVGIKLSNFEWLDLSDLK
ncbi:hypothetical protein [Aestuariibaculum sediminum]|uniref:Lipoprotein n=1 Tax=Aestuariibaculum sediminum TaxID=2770637 RepID=A0A8J6Q371_9FLAO|nr:hypothetical protein [Aestuariibaculum sediminum]MBD0833156.1 hypothetical protein [Aestuariibaculum sediminum]